MNEVKLVIEGLNELTAAVNNMANILTEGNAGHTINFTSPALTPDQAANVAGQAMMLASRAVPVTEVGTYYPQAPVQQTVPTQGVPTTAMPQAYTLEQLQVAAAGLSSMGKTNVLMEILQGFGIQAMTELPRERYGDFATALRGAGAQI